MILARLVTLFLLSSFSASYIWAQDLGQLLALENGAEVNFNIRSDQGNLPSQIQLESFSQEGQRQFYFKITTNHTYEISAQELARLLGQQEFNNLVELLKADQEYQNNPANHSLLEIGIDRLQGINKVGNKLVLTILSIDGSHSKEIEVLSESNFPLKFIFQESGILKVIPDSSEHLNQLHLQNKVANLAQKIQEFQSSGKIVPKATIGAQVKFPWQGKTAALRVLGNGKFALSLPPEQTQGAVNSDFSDSSRVIFLTSELLINLIGQSEFNQIQSMLLEDAESMVNPHAMIATLSGKLVDYSYDEKSGRINLKLIEHGGETTHSILVGPHHAVYKDENSVRIRIVDPDLANNHSRNSVWGLLERKIGAILNLSQMNFIPSTNEEASKLINSEVAPKIVVKGVEDASGQLAQGELNILSNGKVVLIIGNKTFTLNLELLSYLSNGDEFYKIKDLITAHNLVSENKNIPFLLLNLMGQVEFTLEGSHLSLKRKTPLASEIHTEAELKEIPAVIEVMMDNFHPQQLAITINEKGNYVIWPLEQEYTPEALEQLLGTEKVAKIRELIRNSLDQVIAKKNIIDIEIDSEGKILSFQTRDGKKISINNLPETSRLIVMGDHIAVLNLSNEKIQAQTQNANDSGLSLKLLQLLIGQKLKMQQDLEMKNPSRSMVRKFFSLSMKNFKGAPGVAVKFMKQETHTIVLLMALSVSHTLGPKLQEYLDTGDPVALEHAYKEIAKIVSQLPVSTDLWAKIMGNSVFSHLVIHPISKRLMPSTIAELIKKPLLAGAVASDYVALGVFEKSLLPSLSSIRNPLSFASSVGKAINPELLNMKILQQALGFVAFLGWEMGGHYISAIKRDLSETLRNTNCQKLLSHVSTDERLMIEKKIQEGTFLISDLDIADLDSWWAILKNPQLRFEFSVSAFYCLFNDQTRGEIFWNSLHSWSTWDLAATFVALGAGSYVGSAVGSTAARGAASLFLRMGLPRAGALLTRLGPVAAFAGGFLGVIAFATMKEFEVSRQAIYYLDHTLPFQPINNIMDRHTDIALNVFYPEYNNDSAGGFREDLGRFLGTDELNVYGNTARAIIPLLPEYSKERAGAYVLDSANRFAHWAGLSKRELDATVAEEKLASYQDSRNYMLKDYIISLATPLQSIYMELIKYSGMAPEDIAAISAVDQSKNNNLVSLPKSFVQEACYLKKNQKLLALVEKDDQLNSQHNYNEAYRRAMLPSNLRQQADQIDEANKAKAWEKTLGKVLDQLPELAENPEVKYAGKSVLTRERVKKYLSRVEEIMLSTHPILEITLDAKINNKKHTKTFAKLLTENLVDCDLIDLERAFKEENLDQTMNFIGKRKEEYLRLANLLSVGQGLPFSGPELFKVDYLNKRMEEFAKNPEIKDLHEKALKEIKHRILKHKEKVELVFSILFGDKNDSGGLQVAPDRLDRFLYFLSPKFVDEDIKKSLDYRTKKSEILGSLEGHVQNYIEARGKLLGFINQEAERTAGLVDNHKEKVFIPNSQQRVRELLENEDQTNSQIKDSLFFLLDWKDGEVGINGQKVGTLLEWSTRLFKAEEFKKEVDKIMTLDDKRALISSTIPNIERITMELNNECFYFEARTDGVDVKDDKAVERWIQNVLIPDRTRLRRFIAEKDQYVRENRIERFSQDIDPNNMAGLRHNWSRRVEIRQDNKKQEIERQRIDELPARTRFAFRDDYNRQHGRYAYERAMEDPTRRDALFQEEQAQVRWVLNVDFFDQLIEHDDIDIIEAKMFNLSRVLEEVDIQSILRIAKSRLEGNYYNYTIKSKIIWFTTRMFLMPAFQKRFPTKYKQWAWELAKDWEKLVKDENTHFSVKQEALWALAELGLIIPREIAGLNLENAFNRKVSEAATKIVMKYFSPLSRERQSSELQSPINNLDKLSELLKDHFEARFHRLKLVQLLNEIEQDNAIFRPLLAIEFITMEESELRDYLLNLTRLWPESESNSHQVQDMLANLPPSNRQHKVEDDLPERYQELFRVQAERSRKAREEQQIRNKEDFIDQLKEMSQGLWAIARLKISLGSLEGADISSPLYKLLIENLPLQEGQLPAVIPNAQAMEEFEKYRPLIEAYQNAIKEHLSAREQEEMQDEAHELLVARNQGRDLIKLREYILLGYEDIAHRLSPDEKNFSQFRDCPRYRPGDGSGKQFEISDEKQVGGKLERMARGNPLMRQEIIIGITRAMIWPAQRPQRLGGIPLRNPLGQDEK